YGCDFNRAVTAADRVALDGQFARKTPMDRIEAQQMRIGLDRRKIVDGDNFDVGALDLDNRPQNITADPAESVDGNTHRHSRSPVRKLPATRAAHANNLF